MTDRIDKELVRRSLVPSRSKAQELIEAGLVICNNDKIFKSNHLVSETDSIVILENDKLKYVSRGGLKLEKAIDIFNVNFTNLNVMDIGSSTGGFTDCALKHGAKKVLAIDVGTNLMHESLKNDKRVELYEKTNFKNLTHNFFENIDIIVCDVSFISLKQIIEKIKNERIKIDVICLIKPQFECGKEIATKYKGIILNKNIHENIINELITCFNNFGFYIQNFTFSPISGGDGNIEYLALLTNKKDKNKYLNINKIVEEAFDSLRED